MGNTCGHGDATAALLLQWGIPEFHGEYRLGKVLGSGQFGIVRLGMTNTNEEIAVKCISMQVVRNHTHRLARELQTLQQVNHPGATKYYGCYKTKSTIYIGMELCKGGNLKERLITDELTEEEGKTLTAQVLDTLSHMHKLGIIHRDIKQENILFDDNGNAKLADFGLSRCVIASEKMSVVGTPFYLPPELIQGNYSEKCDIWSLGVVLYSALVGKLPFKGNTMAEVCRKISNKNLKNWGNLSPEAIDFLGNMLTKDPKTRLSADDLLQHSWLRRESSTEASF